MPKIQRSTDFFERQDLARRTTVRLLLLFAGVLCFLTLGSYLFLMLFVDAVALMASVEPMIVLMPLLDEETHFQIHPELVLGAIVGTATVILVGSYLRTSTLKSGGAAVAEGLGATEVNSSSTDALTRRYVNVVEEMSLASGVPVPRTYVLEGQAGINAFAAGFTINDAAITVTRGALRQLNRDELQAVVAHEFSHILHGDMRLNIRLIGLLHGILCIYLAGIEMAKGVLPASWTGEVPITQGRLHLVALVMAIPGLFLCLVGIGGMLGSRFIKSGIARQREFLADASAVQYTRNPEALVGALKKIGGFPEGSRLRGAGAEEVSHMCFGEASSSWLTHPPLEDRIQALDPSFNPDLGFTVLDENTIRAELQNEGIDGSIAGDGLDSQSPDVAPIPIDDLLDADDIVAAIGQTSPEQLVYCATLLAMMPEAVMEARNTLSGAIAAAYLLLLDDDKEMRRLQAKIIQEEADSAVAQEAQKLWPALRRLDDELRLPLMDLLLPMLRKMTEEQFVEFADLADKLIRVDGEVSFREFILERVVLHRLELAFGDPGRKSVQFNSFSGVHRDLENVLSAIAFAGTDDVNLAKANFEEGRSHFPEPVAKKIKIRERHRWTFEIIAASMERLSLSAPCIKKAIIDACAHCVMADDEIVVAEIEMLRALCEILDAPLPPFIPRNTRRNQR